MQFARSMMQLALWPFVTALVVLSHAGIAHAQMSADEPTPGWSYAPDAGFVFHDGDFRWTMWGFAERLLNPEGAAYWRRFRQGMEVDFRRFNSRYRSAFVYEVDLTDNDFFRAPPKWKVWENLYYAVQDADDAATFRVLVGQNTHILTLEDNLSSGNLPLISRSLILEEHGSVNSFGTQWGLQMWKTLSPGTVLGVSAQDNRGSLNTDHPRFRIGNSLSAKLTSTVLKNERRGTSLNVGAGVDHTRNIENRTFTLGSAVGSEPLGGTEATGNKMTFEGHVVFTSRVAGHAYAVESEALHSDFSESGTTVSGGYVQGQFALLDTERLGDLVPVLRYDVVRLDRNSISGTARQQSTRIGLNYNLPFTRKLVNFHVEFADNQVLGPFAIVPLRRSFDEFRFELRISATRYLRF